MKNTTYYRHKTLTISINSAAEKLTANGKLLLSEQHLLCIAYYTFVIFYNISIICSITANNYSRYSV